MKLVIFVAFLGLAFAELQHCDFDEAKSEKIGQGGKRSGKEDDDTSKAECMKDYLMVGCECESFEGRDDCDGARIHEDATGTYCIAYNMYGGKGVVARPRCQRMVVTCSTTVTDMPSIGCPDKYKLTGCTMHNSFQHKTWQDPFNTGGRHPVSKRGAGGPCPHAKIDVLVMIESSGTIGAAGYQALIDFAKRGVDLLSLGGENGQIALAQFTAQGVNPGSIFTTSDKTALKQELDAMSFVDAGPVADTLGALVFAQNTLISHPLARADAHGKVLVIMSSGVFADPAGVGATIAGLWNANIFVIASGAGPDVDSAGLDLLTPHFYRLDRVDLATPDQQDERIEAALVAGPTRCKGYCYTSPGCTRCKVQAQCVRVEGILSGEISPEPEVPTVIEIPA